MDLYSSTGGTTPVPGGDEPSREEVQQRIHNLYDQAESASGNYNATRAMASGRPRERANPMPDTGRGRADTVAAPDPALSDRAKQWFDVGRSQLGPLIPAVLPSDRMPERGQTGTWPKSPGGRPGDRQADRPADRPTDRALEAAAKPVLELTAGPAAATAARPVAELTAGPVAALPAAPQARQDATELLPALVTEPQQQQQQQQPQPQTQPQQSRQSLKTSKDRTRQKLAKARELLSARIAQQSAPMAAIAPAPVETAWRTPEVQDYRQAGQTQWPWPSGGIGTDLPIGSMSPDPLLGTTPSMGGQGLTMGGPDLSFGMDLSAYPPVSIGAGVAIGSDGASDSGYGGKAAKAVDFARAQIGKPCVWGATGPGAYDCSSLTQSAWKAAGVALPRTVHDQATAGMAVPLTDLRLGDLVLFHGHVGHIGIYSGNGMMIHAPSPGASIREESILWAGEAAIHSVVRPA
ncbi:C40 family peptidase [Streptomyces sp. NBC_00878]|uniref:C40 family peptidase n=1 Tax=Streptomyces sp. NBC_00878 TaxID=2975854 RepID=UPI0022520B25|nr:C40 family peptidase [Streptomyces sp. NBC_00878]MCX4903520.1 C40 family peptidase [Streptomyces sp. NBC_00878]